MCLQTFHGYTCGHASPLCLVKCPLTLQNEIFPPCSIPAIHQIFANQYCHSCMRCVWNKEVIIEEEAHRGRHERGECACEVIFDRAEREQRERERELGGRESNGRTRQRGRGKGRGAAGDTDGVNGAGTTDNACEKNGGEGLEGKSKQMEESGGDNGMMSPRDNDPASLHPCFEYANNKYMRTGQMDSTGLENTLNKVNPVTGVMSGMPILNPPAVTSASEWYKDMMVILPSPRMSKFGVYPTDPSTLANGNTTNVYQGNYYTWVPNFEPTALIMDHRGAFGQQRAVYPTPPGFMDQFSYESHHNHQQVDHESRRNAYNYVGYYMNNPSTNGPPQSHSHPHSHPRGPVLMTGSPTTGSFMPPPTMSSPSGPAAGAGLVWRHSDSSLPPLPPGMPDFRGAQAATGPSAAPRHCNEPAASPRPMARNAQGNPVQRSRTSKSAGQISIQTPITTTGTTSMDSHTTQTSEQLQTNQLQTAMHYCMTGQATFQGHSRIESDDTPATMDVSILHTPRVISSMPRPNSTV